VISPVWGIQEWFLFGREDFMSKKVVIGLAAAGFLLALAGSAGAQAGPAGWGVEHIGDGAAGSASMSGTTITITGDGHDMWDNSDGFQFMYKKLTGNGSITARVVSVGTGSNTWAKGGVMIRQDNTGPSADAYMVITSNSDGSAGNGGSFQWRATANGSCSNTDSTKVVAAPYWVKLERTGNAFNGSYSPDGKTWTQVGTASVTMTDPVLIGLCVTSHAAGELRTMTFDSLSFSGNVVDYAPKASKPDPADGAKEVTSPLFQWTAGATAVMHEVYMGTNPTPGPAEFMGPWPTNMYFHIPGLTPGAKYYWRVDEVDATGAKTTGDVWSFTVQPLEAHNPDPSDGMMGRALNVKLTWAAGQGAVKHKVLVSADKTKVTAGDASVVAAEQAELTFSPAGLAGGTVYYWRVDEVDST
jgi:regulation of enolase protein 1 (concanavalin A-like superfamily)